MLAKYEAVDEETYQRHLVAFVKSFVVREKRERWINILISKPKRAQRDGYRMINDLDRDKCGGNIYSTLPKLKNKKGIYYEFSGKAIWLPCEDALSIGHGNDAILSIEEGKMAAFFFHEWEEFLCEK